MKRVAFATCRQLPSIKADEQLAVTLLRQQGVDVESALWDSPDVRWGDFDAIVIRTCWDYHLRVTEFLHWIDTTTQKGVFVWNSPDVLTWNSNKNYLRKLESQGIRTIPTEWISRGSLVQLDQLLSNNQWSEAVIKPVVSASAYQTWKTSLKSAKSDQIRLDEMISQSDLMLQPFMAEITTKGEWSLIFFRGHYSHAVVKTPKHGDFRVQPDYGGSFQAVEPPPSIIKQASRIVEMVGCELLYARVDGLDIDGEFILMELELLEPNLFLSANDQGSRRFADAISSII